jgi:hypothetical protein
MKISKQQNRAPIQIKTAVRAGTDDTASGEVAPRDPASGLPTGKRTHKPFTF